MKFSLDNYLEQCIINDISPTDTLLNRDSQILWLLKSLENIDGKTIVDYGCGNCRLFEALKRNIDKGFNYFAVDTSELCTTFSDDNRYNYIDTEKVFKLTPQSVDYFVACNVIHELSIIQIAEMFEKARFLLKNNGTLIICDMMILPKGELTAFQWYSEDFSYLFGDFLDESFLTRTGFPILALKINRDQIKVFKNNIKKIEEVFANHSTAGAILMSRLDHVGEIDFKMICNELKLPDTTQKQDVLGYLLHRIGVAHFRVIQNKQRKKLISEDTYQIILSYIVGIYDLYYRAFQQCTIFDLYRELCPHFPLYQIAFCLEQTMNFIGGTAYFFPEKNGNAELTATEHLDDFFDQNPQFENMLYNINLKESDKNNVVKIIQQVVEEYIN